MLARTFMELLSLSHRGLFGRRKLAGCPQGFNALCYTGLIMVNVCIALPVIDDPIIVICSLQVILSRWNFAMAAWDIEHISRLA